MHGYWSIDMEILHTTATAQLPSFAHGLREILDTLTAETGHDPLHHPRTTRLSDGGPE